MDRIIEMRLRKSIQKWISRVEITAKLRRGWVKGCVWNEELCLKKCFNALALHQAKNRNMVEKLYRIASAV